MSKETPVQVRFEPSTLKRLKKVSGTSGIAQVDLIRFATDRLFQSLPTTDELLAAYIRSRSSAAE